MFRNYRRCCNNFNLITLVAVAYKFPDISRKNLFFTEVALIYKSKNKTSIFEANINIMEKHEVYEFIGELALCLIKFNRLKRS